jgi:glycosyltransferase involved in cell wall biosynthesis
MLKTLCVVCSGEDLNDSSELSSGLDGDFFDEVFILGEESRGTETAQESFENGKLIQTNIGYADEDYWLKIIRALADQPRQVMVVTATTQFTNQLLKLHHLLNANVAAVFPLSTAHPASCAFLEPRGQLLLDPSSIEAWLGRFATQTPIEVPTFSGTTGWLNLSLIPASVGSNDQENANQFAEHGLSLLVSDEAYVDDSMCQPSASLPASLHPTLSEALLLRHPYTRVRHPLTEVHDRGELPPQNSGQRATVTLHISHGWGGGLSRWIEDYAEADESSVNLILRPVGDWDAAAKSLRLFDSQQLDKPVRDWTLTTPIISTSAGSFEYAAILNQIISEFSVTTVLISSLIGHSLDLFRAGIPTIQILHDFYPWCPPIYASWGSPCTSCDARRLKDCLSDNPGHQFFKGETFSKFSALRASFLELVIKSGTPLVAPSQSVKDRWIALADELVPSQISVIPHGLQERCIKSFSENRWEAKPEVREIVVLGQWAVHKGAEILTDALPYILNRARVTLLGAGSDLQGLKRHRNLTVVPRFDNRELPTILSRIKPDIGLLLSTVPETFSYTLSEFHAAGVPVIATDSGAFSERIEHGVNGWLIQPNARDLLNCVDTLISHPQQLAATKANILSSIQRSSLEMVSDYGALIGTELKKYPPPVTRAASPLSNSLADHNTANLVTASSNPTYREALRAFLRFSEIKVRGTPKLHATLKPPLVLALRGLEKLVG